MSRGKTKVKEISLLGVLILLGLANSACLSSGGAADGASSFPIPPPVDSVSVTVTVKTGSGFECLILDSSVYCRGVSDNADVGVSSVEFTPYASDSDSNITGLLTRDDTLCFSSIVAERPYSGTPGEASYCIGEATLQNTAGGQPVVYGGPNFTSAANGSADLSYDSEPMMGADLSLPVVLSANMLTDGVSSVTEREEDCTLIESTLTCETFTLEVL